MPLRVVPSSTGLPSKRCPGIGFFSRAYQKIALAVVRNLPAVQEMGIQSLGQEGPLEEETTLHSNFLLDNSMDRGAWRAAVHGVA